MRLQQFCLQALQLTDKKKVCETATIHPQSTLPEVNHPQGLEEYTLLENAKYIKEMGN